VLEYVTCMVVIVIVYTKDRKGQGDMVVSDYKGKG
jgi:hypothetical protein